MKSHMLIVLSLIAGIVHSEVIITPKGTSVVSQSGSTTWVTGTGNIAVTPTVNSVTGIGTLITPQGTFLVSKQGSTTTVIQTSKGK